MCFVPILEQTATSALYCTNWLVFITEMESVYCSVSFESLYNADTIRLRSVNIEILFRVTTCEEIEWLRRVFSYNEFLDQPKCYQIFKNDPILGGADKTLARPGRKQTTATKLGIYSTYSPRSSIHFLACCSLFFKPLKKISDCPSNQVSTAWTQPAHVRCPVAQLLI